MEDAIKGSKGGSSASKTTKLLRYPLRSSIKSDEEKSVVVEPSATSDPRRRRAPSSVSKSVSVLDLSGKEKATKPPRRLSIPAKSTGTPAPKTDGNITPISESRANRPVNSKSENPTSDLSRSANRKKYCAISSASYWLSQIKLSESAAKHSISLGFFKLALEAGCEIQRLRDELKSYARRYNLAEFGESAKELLVSYNITENVEQLQVSETISQVPEEGTRTSDDDSHSSSSVSRSSKLKPKCLNTCSPPKDSGKVRPQKTNPEPRTKTLANKKPAKSSSNSEIVSRQTNKKSQMPNTKESGKAKCAKIEKKKSAKEEGPINPSPSKEEGCEENKENMDAPATQMEEISLTEV